ncbi:MAG TPA: ABC transporter ATP-binding protein [Lacibacter sp.]|nr:ABC transporter ATP-binding protein [Lacibacter sp.]HMO88655.1 ABC transporter ATP-binding protein [Lacibacter sp.]
MNTVIKVENLSKQYRLGSVSTGTLSHDLNRWWHRVRGKEDPYLMIGESNDRATKGNSEYVWALRDINFEVKHGEVLGIIGRNGAGKSTLLKILSRTTAPTTGSVKIKGRVASLLEVGTGFHPELTGRENIFLNGAILGMTKREIARKFDEIVDFAGVERYVDTPVKRYSSGMYVRLAFAVAAHLEPEILIIDEVLAVGDAEFQKKCLGKMKDVSVKEGRTVLFVSHNMEAIKNICSRGILLQHGRLTDDNEVLPLVDNYLRLVQKNEIIINEQIFTGEGCQIGQTRIITDSDIITNGDELIIQTQFSSYDDKAYSVILGVNRNEQVSFLATSFFREEIPGNGKYEVRFRIPPYLLNPGYHTIDIKIVDDTGNFTAYLHAEEVLAFTVFDDNVRRGNKYNKAWGGAVSPLLEIDWQKI